MEIDISNNRDLILSVFHSAFFHKAHRNILVYYIAIHECLHRVLVSPKGT